MDLSILIWFHKTFHGAVWLNYLMMGITYLGEFGGVAILTAAVLLIFKRTRRAGLMVAVALVLDLLIVNVILKNAVNRARPWTEYKDFVGFYNSINLRLPTDSSFPSGHTASCFCAAVALLFTYKVKALPALVVALLVAISRLYLCVHYPTDVLAGALIGSAIGAASYFGVNAVINKIKAKRAKQPEE